MHTLRRRSKGFVWLALAAMLAMALLPALAHARAASHAGQDGWAEVCTPRGTQWVEVDAAASGATNGTSNGAPGAAVDGAPAGDAAQAGLADHLADCPACLPSLSAGLPPSPWPAWRLPASGTDAPPLFLHAPRTLFAWACAHPRAPPALG